MRKLIDRICAFWCAPLDGRHLILPRALLGALFLYSLGIHALNLPAFMSEEGWLPASLLELSPRYPYNVTWLTAAGSLSALYAMHAAAVVVASLYTAGIALRVTAPAVALTALAYVNRNEYVLFGFDQTLTPFLIYLAFHSRGVSIGNRVSQRLVQLHLCLIYAGAGFAKLHPSWFDGTGLWRVLATFETSRPELSWLVDALAAHPAILAVAGAVVVLWECSYPLLVWVRPARPVVLLLAIAVHGGIGVFMRLGSFSAVMIAANMSFVPAEAGARCIRVARLSISTLRRKAGFAGPPLAGTMIGDNPIPVSCPDPEEASNA